MSDAMGTIGRSVIQYGPGNDRVYLMKLHPEDAHEIVEHLDLLAAAHGYSKVFAKVPALEARRFVAAGYELEASVPCFYRDGTAACFLGKYLLAGRRHERNGELLRQVLAAAGRRSPETQPVELPEGFSVRPAGEEDAEEMAEVYREVFASYPFPIHDPVFIRAAMAEHTRFYGVWHGERIVALSSAEMDSVSGSAEMTDFATLPGYRGHGLALYLLQRMEEAMPEQGVRSFYTIARAYSFGMNITFARNGYDFGGTLTNNTNISGSLESMNVWYKRLP